MSRDLPNGVLEANISASKDILTTKEAANYLVKSPGYLRNNCKRLGIKSYKIGKQLRFRRSELDSWLEAHCN